MAGDQENLQKQLEEAMEKLKEEKQRAEEREKKLKEEIMARENRERELERKLEQKNNELRKLSPGLMAEGNMKWDMEVEKVEDYIIFSSQTSIGDLSFRLGCKKEKEKNGSRICPAIYLYCNENSTSKTYSALVEFTLKIASPTDSTSNSYCNIFLPTVVSHGGPAEYQWKTYIDPRFDYVKNGLLTIEARIKMIYHYKDAIVDFASPDTQFSDVTLLVEGRKFHANRNYLAIHCEYFRVLFGSNFAEKNEKEIKLEEVDASDFEEMLRVIYPERKKPTAATVKGLLHLADFFGIRAVQMECADFLMGSTDFSLIAKLQLSEEFGLSELQYRLVESLKETKDVKTVIDSADFAHLSVTLQKSLLEKHYKLG